MSEKFVNEILYDEKAMKYEVKLPWKPSHGNLPTNYENYARRLGSLHNTLKKQPETLIEYHRIITEQLANGQIERCDVTPSSDDTTKRVHYLPHRGVTRDNAETTKLRIVYDASSKATKSSASLNDCLFKGPSLTPLLFDVLVRFRLHLVAFVSDIQKAFLQIKVNENDRDALRFLWFLDPFDPDPTMVAHRFTCVLFGLNCSPFLLNGTLRHHLMKFISEHKDLIAKILRSLYVDDFTGGCDTVDDAKKLYELFVRVLREGGFPVHKFVTNNAELQQLID